LVVLISIPKNLKIERQIMSIHKSQIKARS
jgi:hypothetical protein